MFLNIVARIFTVQFPQQGWPDKCAAKAAGLYLHGVCDAIHNLWIDLNEIAGLCLARQGVQLNFARAFKNVHLQKGVGNGFSSGE